MVIALPNHPAPAASNVSTAAWLTSATVVAICALAFTIASFWWLNARRGRLKTYEPHTFAAAITPQVVRLRLPLVLYNTGAIPIIVQNLRVGLTAASHVFVINPVAGSGTDGYLRCLGHGRPPAALAHVTEWIAPRKEWDRRMTSWEPTGPLTWPGDDALPSPRARQRQVNDAERRVDELRAELERAEAEAARLRARLSG